MIKKYAKVIGILCKCGILAIKVEWFDRKSRRLARKGRSLEAYATAMRALELCEEAKSYIEIGHKIIEEG